MARFYIKTLFRKIKNSHRLSQILILVSFLISFLIIRIITHAQKAGILPTQNGNLHIHHLVPGIIFILISGYVGLSFWSSRRIRLLMSLLFGVGSALTVDEFALWLHLRDVYWERSGRDSIDAVIITIAIFTIAFVLAEIHDHRS